jgi:hypothetical protein
LIGSKRQLRFGVAHTAGQIDETKTVSSKAKLPLAPALAELLLGWKMQSEFDWIFANPATGMPYMSPSLQQRRIRPAGEPLGIEGLGFHSLRHSYRSWLDSVGAAPGITKDLMRHSAIATTFNVYGRAMSDEKREAYSKVVNLLLSNAMLEIPILDRASGCGKCNRRPSQKVGKGGRGMQNPCQHFAFGRKDQCDLGEYGLSRVPLEEPAYAEAPELKNRWTIGRSPVETPRAYLRASD